MHLYIGHFWSLCVEEQFYLVWPFLVYRVRSREALIKICIGVVLAMPLLRWLLTVVVPPGMLRLELFYRSLPTRLDALLIDGLIALSLRGPEQAWLRTSRRWLLAAASVLFGATYVVATYVLHLRIRLELDRHRRVHADRCVGVPLAPRRSHRVRSRRRPKPSPRV